MINENSYVDGSVTSRIGTDGSYNTAYGVDGIFKISENDHLNLKWAQGIDNPSSNRMFSLDLTRIHLNISRFNQKGLNYDFTWSRSGKDFNPEIGFMMRNNYTHYFGSFGYGWIPGKLSSIQNHGFRFGNKAFTDNLDNSVQSFETELSFDLSFKSDFRGMIALKHICK